MTKTNNLVFWSLYVIVWLIFVGLSIEAGGLIVNFIVSLYNPEIIQRLYQKLDLTGMFKENKLVFYVTYGFIITIAILKACLFYIVIRLMHKMDRSKPFSTFVSKQISLVSYFALSIGLISYMAKLLTKNLLHFDFATYNLNQFWVDSEAFIFMGAVVHIIAIIFKKGVELQNENDLTL